MSAYPSNWFILFPLAFSLFVGLQLSVASVDLVKSSRGVQLVRTAIAIMFAFAVLAIGLRPSPMSLTWIGLLIASAIVLSWKSRRLDRSAMLLTAMSAHDLEQRQTVFGYFFEENVGWIRRRADAIRRDIAAGMPWAKSLELRGIARGVREKLMIRMQSVYGATESKKSDEYESTSGYIELETERLIARLLLFVWIGKFGAILVLFAMFVLPTIQELSEEFGVELPHMGQSLLEISNFVVESGLLYPMAIIPLVLAAAAMLVTAFWLFPSLLQLRAFRWISDAYYRNAALGSCAAILVEQPDLTQACRKTGDIFPIRYLAERYYATADQIEKGVAIQSAFQKTGLITQKELAAFGQGIGEHEPIWMLQQLSSWKSQRFLHRMSIAVQLAVVALTLFFAAIVAVVALTVIGFLVSMIMSISY